MIALLLASFAMADDIPQPTVVPIPSPFPVPTPVPGDTWESLLVQVLALAAFLMGNQVMSQRARGQQNVVLTEQTSMLKDIKIQTEKTNGRVTALELSNAVRDERIRQTSDGLDSLRAEIRKP